ncbi:MAG: serine/threonine protein kinase [Polyangiaceae bacterium]|nr:protein kinase [Polyangiaceae bacterium]NUQ75523.1 serine/threonine protein kinase [Polyangiaceae bacterium]
MSAMEVTNVPQSPEGAVPEGSILDKYRLIAELGHGGMAEVFLAVASGPAGFNKLVVIKQIRAELADDPEFLNMFLDEARLAARLSHPNVVQTNEVGHVGNRYFIAMEYLDGQPLNRILQRFKRDNAGMPLGMHVRILIDVLAGLHHAHELADYDGTPLEVVHRDVSPHNVFVTYDGQIKVVDFGIAKAMNSSSETRAGVIKGKVAYMSPEQARGDKVDRRSDIFAVGVMFWEAMTGQRLWKGLTDVAMLHRIIKGEIPNPKTIKGDLSERMVEVCMKALAPNRDDRYETAADFQNALEDLLTEMGERTAVRDIGKLVAKTFDQDRVRIKSVIEAQIKKSSTSTTTLPSIDPLGVSGIHGGGNTRPSLPTLNSGSFTQSGLLTTDSPTSVGQKSTPSSVALTASRPPEASSKTGIMIAGAILGAALIGAVVWLVAMPSGPKETPAPAVTATPPTTIQVTSTPSAPEDPEVEIKVNVNIPEAKIFIDDQPVIGNPYAGKFKKDKNPHQVRAEAPGYGTKTRTIGFENNLQVEIVLEKQAAESAPSKPHVGGPVTPPPPPPPEDPMKAPKKPNPGRELDTTNPY